MSDCFEKHVEVGVGVLAAYSVGFVGINLKRRLLIKEVVQEMLDDLLSEHVPDSHFSRMRELMPEFKVLGELGPAFGHRSGQKG